MKNSEKIPEDFKIAVGDRYLHNSGCNIRTILSISGSKIHWEDAFGEGICEKVTFLKICSTKATDKDIKEYKSMKNKQNNDKNPLKRRGSLKK